MPNVQIENSPQFASNEQFNAIWKMTRAMKAAGYVYKSSSDASTKDTTGNPANDKWGGGGTVQGPTVAAITIGAPTTTSYGGRSTLTGLAGFTSSSVGHYLTITGATNSANNGTWLITNFISANSVVIQNPAAVAETTPGTASYTELSSLLDTYPAALQGASGAGAWWNAQGPSTLKIPIGNALPIGYIRGENVTQATSNATGELLGVIPDPVGGNGYIVIAPRLSGTGSGVRGWSNSAVITGSKSSVTFTPTSNVIEFIREMVIWKSTATNGHIYQQVIDVVNETSTTSTTGRFSTMAASATITVCPGGASGGNPTTNGFPTVGTYVVLGTGGSGANSTGTSAWLSNLNSTTTGFIQILIANEIEDTNVSADGTITVVVGTPSNSTTSFIGIGFHRVDDQEDGDVDPYVWFAPSSTGGPAYSGLRTARTSQINAIDEFILFQNLSNGGSSGFAGWRRRGYSTNDSFVEFQGASYCTFNSQSPLVVNPSTPDRVACSFVNIAVREPIWVVNVNTGGQKIRKGTLRWWFAVQGGSGTDTYDGKRWIQLSSNINGPVVVGPADAVTTPSNS